MNMGVMRDADSILQVENLYKRFGGVAAVNGCTLGIRKGSVTGLIGPNGSGKTTLFNLISGHLRPDAGRIFLKGRMILGRAPNAIVRKGLARTFQVIRVFGQMTALENLLVCGEGEGTREKALALLDRVGLLPYRDEYAASFSYGMQKLLEFVRVLMVDPEVILLDEPAAGVNPTMRRTLWAMVRELQAEGKTFLIIEHDIPVIVDLCEQVYVLDHGEVIARGAPAEIQRNEQVIEAYFGR